jgi:hypothetical protein
MGDDDTRDVEVGHARVLVTEQPCDSTVSDVLEVGDPLGEVAAERLELRGILLDGGGDRGGGAGAGGEQLADGLLQAPVTGDEGGRREDLLGRLVGGRGALLERHRDRLEDVLDPLVLGRGVGGGRFVGRRAHRRADLDHRPDGRARADPDAAWDLSGHRSSLRVEVAREQGDERVEGGVGTLALGGEDDLFAVLGAQGHDAQDARGVDGILAGPADLDVESGLGGGLDEERRGPGVQADGRGDGDGAGGHEGWFLSEGEASVCRVAGLRVLERVRVVRNAW